MIKTLFTLSLVAFGLLAHATETPFRKSPQHPARQQVRSALAKPAAVLRQSRNENLPDSMHLSSWENNAWQLEEVAGLQFDTRGRLEHMHLYDQAGPHGSRFAVVDYRYTTRGEISSYVFSSLFAGLRREQFRLDFNYDANGNKTSGVIQMPDSAGTMVPIFGDSIAYTYNQGREVRSATLYVLDFINFTGWIPLQQITNIQWTVNGHPKAFELAHWDDVNGLWGDLRRFDQLQWGFGWNGFSRLFGTMQFEVDFSLYEPVDFRFDEPTNYHAQIFDNGRWIDDEIRVSEYDNNLRVITLRNAYPSNGSWTDANLLKFVYNPHGIESVTTYLFDQNVGNHVPFNRTTYSYHGNGSMSMKEDEMHNGSSWQRVFATTYAYALNTSEQVANQLIREYDPSTQLFSNLSLTEFFYRQPVAASSRELARSIPMEVYPNPTLGSLNIGIGGDLAAAEIRVRNLQGQLLISQKCQPGNGPTQLSIESLPAGIYLVEAVAGSQLGVMRVVKQ